MAQAVVLTPNLSITAEPPGPLITGLVSSIPGNTTQNGLGDAVGDWRPVSVGAQRLEMFAKMLGIRYRKTVCYSDIYSTLIMSFRSITVLVILIVGQFCTQMACKSRISIGN
jgi:hypothetical protein